MNGAKATAKETKQSVKPVRATAPNASRAGATKRSMEDSPLQNSGGETDGVEHSHSRAKTEEFDFEFEESRQDQEATPVLR